MQNEAKIKELFDNEAFVNKFNEATNPEELKGVFEEFGLEISDEDLTELIKAPMDEQKEELSEDDLGDVSGGVVGAALWALKKTCQYSVNYWGGPKEAVVATYSFWRNVFR